MSYDGNRYFLVDILDLRLINNEEENDDEWRSRGLCITWPMTNGQKFNAAIETILTNRLTTKDQTPSDCNWSLDVIRQWHYGTAKHFFNSAYVEFMHSLRNECSHVRKCSSTECCEQTFRSRLLWAVAADPVLARGGGVWMTTSKHGANYRYVL